MKIDSAHAHRMTPSPPGAGREPLTSAAFCFSQRLVRMFVKRLLHVGLRQTKKHLQGAWRRGAERPGVWRAAVRGARSSPERPASLPSHWPLLQAGLPAPRDPPLLTPPVVPFKFSYADEHQTNLVRELRTSQRLRFELRSYSKPTRLFFFFFKSG